MRELSLHILDIVENSLEAGATKIELQIIESTARNCLTIAVRDNGRGMDQETLQRVCDPFYTTRTTRQVGLGIPLLKAAAERCNGKVIITSQPGQGTCVMAEFERNHIDRAPLGDMRSTLLSVILSNQQCAIHYLHGVDACEFVFDTQEMSQLLGGVPLDHPRVREWLDDFLAEGYQDLYAGPSD